MHQRFRDLNCYHVLTILKIENPILQCKVKVSSSIRLAVFWARGDAREKLHSKFVWERFATAIKIDRIPLLDVH